MNSAAIDEREHLGNPLGAPGESVRQQTDSDHLARLEGVRQSPRNAIAAMHHDAMSSPDLTLTPNSLPSREGHHQEKDRDQKETGELAGDEVEAVQKSSENASGCSFFRLAPIIGVESFGRGILVGAHGPLRR